MDISRILELSWSIRADESGSSRPGHEIDHNRNTRYARFGKVETRCSARAQGEVRSDRAALWNAATFYGKVISSRHVQIRDRTADPRDEFFVLAFCQRQGEPKSADSVSYTHLRAHETDSYLVCRL